MGSLVRRALLLTLCLLGVLFAGCRRGPDADDLTVKVPRRPNIIIYLVDTLRRDHLGVYGYERRTSPRLDAFAKDAVVFEDAYSSSGWTKPAVASLLSGLNPVRHGAVTRTNVLPDEVRVAGEFLDPLGYYTAAVFTNPNVIAHWGFGQGFEEISDILSATRNPYIDADTVNEHALRLISQAGERPFFLYVHTMDPHGPYEPRPPYDTLFTDRPGRAIKPYRLTTETPVDVVQDHMAEYDGEIAFGDEQFGLLLDHLKEQGLYDQALIVFVSDHGEEFLDHGRGGHSHTVYQELVRVPLMIKFPGGAGAGRRIAAPVGLIDVLPTLLAYLGEDPPAELEGDDLLPVVSGKSPSVRDRPFFFDLDVDRPDETLNVVKGVLWGPYKLIRVEHPEPRDMLFEVTTDPREQNDLFATRSEPARELSTMLSAYVSNSSAGMHLRCVNGPGQKDRVIEGVLKTEGRFVGFQRVQLEEHDQAAVQPDGRTITFRFKLVSYPHPLGRRPKWIVDQDQITFRVDPPEAGATFERLTWGEGEPAPLLVGLQRRRIEDLSVVFREDDPDLRVRDMNMLFRNAGLSPLESGGAAYFVVVPRVEEVDQPIPDKLRETLKSLGYIKDG